MRQRLVAQLGLGVFALTLLASGALADSSNPGTTLSQNSGSTISASSSGTLAISNSQDPTQTVGPSSPGDASGGSSGTQNTPSGDPLQPSTLGPNSVAAPPGSSLSQPIAPLTAPNSPSAPIPGATALGATSAIPDPGTGRLTTSVEAAISRIVNQNPGVTMSALAPPSRPSAAPASGLPTPPQSPAGFLDVLHSLLASTIIPATLGMGGLATPLVPALAVLVVLGLLITLPSLVLPPNTYTARLRRSGFLGAARSDVGAAGFLFATPLEMGCIGARASGRTHF